ncbi:50S ribosomal protein L32 [Candidatus Daviesbacteria bacterium RIFOXYD1_FULL_41_10]|uniref:Large ribosomal subunit protein bL32 n=1 Tax=Candidatus Daviesbacteria bacterium RIFOXYD1_FULL_41_10 TaxID=1797801 RepID=A0A1F5N2J3_9BACT|nr:MAG: 50S ribosomal protein L32 [Candidatus Daviesbacteria bacterium RIFOXYD1_FULL_41_10]
MPQEPKKKHSKARKRTRRASIKLTEVGLIFCPNCKKPALPHQVCRECGFYGGKQIKAKQTVKVTKA